MSNEPIKIAAFLRPIGTPASDYFLIEKDSSVSINSGNFSSFEQGNPNIILDFVTPGFLGTGYMRQGYVRDTADESYPKLTYPIKVDSPGRYRIYFRLYASSSEVRIKLYLNDDEAEDVVINGLPISEWVWIEHAITIPDKQVYDLGVVLASQNINFDALHISQADLPADLNFASTFCTIHSKMYKIGADSIPTDEAPTYDARNTLFDIVKDDWYMFSTEPMTGHTSLDIDDNYVFLLFISGSTESHYILWDYASEDEDIDPYLMQHCSFSYNATEGRWVADCSKQFSLRVYTYRDAFDGVNCTLSSPPAELVTDTIEDFDDEDKSPVYLNTKVVENTSSTNKVELNLPSRVVSLLIDESGSQSYNDNDGLRHDLSRRMLNRLNATYPGDLKYNIFTIAGTPIKLNFFAVIETEDVNTSDAGDVASAYFADQESGFAGVRVIRRTGTYPSSPVDGDIVTEGFLEKAFDDGLTENTEYFYKVFTFDANNRFSRGVEIRTTPRVRDIPRGIGQFTYNLLRGSGLRKTANTVGIWHMNEKTGSHAYDFTDSQIHLAYSEEESPIWLNQRDVPIGLSGIRLSGSDSFEGSDDGALLWSDTVTFAGWVYPLSGTGVEEFFSYGDQSSNGLYIGRNDGQVFFTYDHSTYVYASGLTPNEWNHIAVTINNAGAAPDVSIYINGSLSASGSLPSTMTRSAEKVSIGRSLYSGSNYFFGKVTDFSIHNTILSNSEIFSLAQPNDNTDQDNGDRLLLLNYSIPNDFSFVGGRVRILEKQNNGTKFLDTITNPADGTTKQAPAFGLPPYHEEDGNIVYDVGAFAGSFTTSISDDFIHGHKYFYKIFSQKSDGNWCFESDAPVLEVEIPIMSNREEYIGDPSPELSSVEGFDATVGNRKIYLTWNEIADTRIKQVKVWYGLDSYPIIENGKSSSELVFIGDETSTEFVHRQISNDVRAFYAIVAFDQYGHQSEPVYLVATPNEDANEISIPLLDIRKLKYEVVSEESVSLSWENPVKFEKDIEGWFDQRVIFFAQITDEFGSPLEDLDDVQIVAESVSVRGSNLVEDVFGEVINRNVIQPLGDDVYVLSCTPIGNGFIKGVLRLSADVFVLSALDSVEFSVVVFSKVADRENPNLNVFEFYSKPIRVVLNNPWQMEIINYSADSVRHLCKKEVPLFDSEFLTTLSFNPDLFKEFDGTYVRRSRPFVARVKASYRGSALPAGNKCYVAVHEASDPQCDPEDPDLPDWTPTFSDLRSKAVIPPSPAVDFYNITVDEGGVQTRISVADIPLTPPRSPQGVMLFVKASYNGYVSRKKMYVVFENILRVDATVNGPSPDCTDRREQFASCYLINPDDPEEKNPIPDLEICRWQIRKGLTGKDRPFYSTDNVPNGDGVFSYVRDGTAKRIFFGPACGVVAQAYAHPELGAILLPEIYAIKASVVYDGLQAFEDLPVYIFPEGSSSLTGSYRFLMEFPNIINEIWADGYDYEVLKITHDANSSATRFSSCFRQCVSQLGSDIFRLNSGQIVNVYTNDMESVFGDDVDVHYDEEIDEYVIVGGTSAIVKAAVPISNTLPETSVYLKINKFVGPPENNGSGSSSASSQQNQCGCLEIGSDQGRDSDLSITADTLLLISGEERTLRGGGDIKNGIPPTIIRLREPLAIRFVDQRVNGEPVNEIVIDGVTRHEFIIEVSFSGKSVPDGTPIKLEVGGSNPEKIILTPDVVTYTKKENDAYLNPLGEPISYARFEIEPISPANSFSAQIRATATYDKRGDVEREMSSCISIAYDVNQVTEEEEEDQDKRTIDNVFSKRLDRYDVNNNEWVRLADMSHPRGGLVAQWSADEYGEKIWAIGGVDGNRITAYNEEYDIANNVWSDVAAMPTARFYHMSAMYNGYIYVFGGVTFENNELVISRAVERYDPIADEWESLASMPYADAFEQDAYGVALGNAVVSGDKVYIVGGVRKITSTSQIEKMNDRVLVYDIPNNEWSISSVYDNQDLYQRIAPVSFVKTESDQSFIHIVGGATEVLVGDKNVLQFLTTTAKINTQDLTIELDDYNYQTLPTPRHKAMSSVLSEKVYILGGSNNITQAVKLLDILDISSSSPFSYESGANLPRGKSGAGLTNDNYQYLYLAGGIESGRPPGFLQINAKATPTSVKLDGRQSVGIDISLQDDSGSAPPPVRVFVRGFVVLPNAKTQQGGTGGGDQGQQGSAGSMNRNDLVYPVVFSKNDFVVEGGFGSTIMLPRSEDILRNIKDIKEKLGIQGELVGEGFESDKLVVREGEIRVPYSIRVQISIIDDFYYGETVVDIQDNIDEIEQDPYLSPSVGSGGTPEPSVEEEFEGCTPIETTKIPSGGTGNNPAPNPNNNINIEGLPDNETVFDMTPPQIKQLPSPQISYFSDIEWIPQVNAVLSGNDGTYEQAIRSLNSIASKIPFGGSPLYDGIVSIAQDLLDDSADGLAKVVYVHTDNEENLSKATASEAIDEIQSIDGFGKVPIVINSYSVVFPITLSALVSRTDTESLETIANQTGGQSQTILSATFVDEVLNNSIGRMIGSIGYGLFEYTIDLGFDCIISKISVDYLLFDNTDGNWKISVSSDGFNYTEYSDQFAANTEVDFTDLAGRYVRLQMVVLSGLSASTEEAYEDIATPGSPAITAINITYSIPKISHLFVNTETLPYSAQQIAVSINANRPLLSDIDAGAATSDTYNWLDYQSGSQIPIDQHGKIFIPIRAKQDDISLNEPLESIDGFAFKTKYGRWNYESRVVIRDADGSIIDEDLYRAFPRTGLVVFSEKQTKALYIDIENTDQLRVGVRIVNRNAGESVTISGLGYMYNTNVFLPPPLSERPPFVVGVQISPSTPTIFSKMSVSYDYNDLNRDLEDEENSVIRWYINGVEREYLKNLRSWNDIEDSEDPLWVYAFQFQQSDVPSGMTTEEYARQQQQSILKVGDSVYVTVKPFDGKGYGEETRSTAVVVVEAPPFVTSLAIKGRRSNGILQETVTTATTAIASYNFFADNPDNKSTIVWFVNGTEFKRGNLGESVAGFSNDEILPNESSNNVTALEIGNTIEVEILPSTAIKIGDPVRSSSITVENQPPEAINVLISPSNPTSTSNLIVTYTFVDADVQNGEPLQNNQSSIRWFKTSPGSEAFFEVIDLRDQTSVPASQLSPNENWKCQIIPFDGVSVGETAESNIVTIN